MTIEIDAPLLAFNITGILILVFLALAHSGGLESISYWTDYWRELFSRFLPVTIP